MSTFQNKYLTRDELHTLLRQHGYPIGRGTLDKLCAPACGEGPPIAAVWPGRKYDRPLYDAATALAWANNRLKAGAAA